MIIYNTSESTIFVTNKESMVKDILKSSGIKNVNTTKDYGVVRLDKKLNTSQLKKVRYYLQKKLSRYIPNKEFVDMPEIIRGFKGCLISGEKLRYLS